MVIKEPVPEKADARIENKVRVVAVPAELYDNNNR